MSNSTDSDLVSTGWFFQPNLEASGPAGFRLSNRGSVEKIRGESLIRQAILMLLSTRRGERVMRPSYGCELDKLVFLPNDVTTAGLAIHYARRAIEQWEPRVEILELDAQAAPEAPSYLEISLSYRIRSTGTEDRISLSIDLSGGGP